ncbi:GNAT family N-acetyltransferase [Cellulomonas sp.]|uniref:GNAT family N-acetyltransferase n=1 Tax=Cellulomonas sp. TaxID=40001 RepID=UPI00281221C1|nr:GNAT family N-acetyltransferase [Cellulomonas sp.]
MPPRGRVPVWWLRSVRAAAAGTGEGDVVVVHAVAGDERPDRAVVDVADLPPGLATAGRRVGRVTVRAGSLQLLTAELLVEGAPPLVVVERVLRDARPPLAELVAFPYDLVAGRAAAVGARTSPGAVLTARDVARIGLASRDQVGALRWSVGTGQVLEVYVAPAHRRRRVATSLLLAAEGAAAARGWPRLWTGGVRTALGEAVAQRLRWGAAARVAPLTELAPPMTPPGDGVGVPRHHLEPDA